MTWTLTEDVEEYAAAAWPLLVADPVRFTWQLSAIAGVRSGATPAGAWFGWWRAAGGGVEAVLSSTPPHPLLVAAADDALPDGAAEALVQVCRAAGRELTGVQGDPSSAAQVAACWCHLTGGAAQLDLALRLFRLGELRVPREVPGRGEVAGGEDLSIIRKWADDFAAETGMPVLSGAALADRASNDGWLLWRTPDGRAAAMAGLSRPDGGVTRIGLVYTPRDLRRRGYAAAVTAFAARCAPDSNEVALLTDLTNPTSNGVYQRIGFRPVADRLSFLLTMPS